MDCETCQETWKDFGQNPPCATCKPPLASCNEEAVLIYSQCSGQWIVGPGGLIDLNVLAVLEIMKLKKIKNMDECLEKVQLIASEILKARK